MCQRMKLFVSCLFFVVLLSRVTATPRDEYTLFFTKELPYLENVKNLTHIRELSEFFDVQSAIYAENVYQVVQKFFFKLLDDLPKSSRTKQLKRLVWEMDRFLDVENDLMEKYEQYENFEMQFSDEVANIFEYDPDETLLAAEEFNDLFVGNDVDAVLKYAEDEQLSKFAEHTGDGIRLFLILNRPYLDKGRVPEIKLIVDEFLERREFREKRNCLRKLLKKAIELNLII